MWFSCFRILTGSAEAQAIWGGIVKRLLIAYFIGNISAKIYIHYIYIFGGSCPWRNFARCKIHFSSKSCVLLYWQRYCTALQQRASAILCGVVQGMELRNFRRGCHLCSAGRPSRWVLARISSYRLFYCAIWSWWWQLMVQSYSPNPIFTKLVKILALLKLNQPRKVVGSTHGWGTHVHVYRISIPSATLFNFLFNLDNARRPTS